MVVMGASPCLQLRSIARSIIAVRRSEAHSSAGAQGNEAGVAIGEALPAPQDHSALQIADQRLKKSLQLIS
jgi:hypothetical protein